MTSFGHSVSLAYKKISHCVEKGRIYLAIEGINTQDVSVSKALSGINVFNIFRVIHTTI